MTDLATKPLDELRLDEAARPKAPLVPEATDLHRRQGRQLAEIHSHYLRESDPQLWGEGRGPY